MMNEFIQNNESSYRYIMQFVSSKDAKFSPIPFCRHEQKKIFFCSLELLFSRGICKFFMAQALSVLPFLYGLIINPNQLVASIK